MSKTKQDLNIAIIGAGIGGLSLAGLLYQAGYKCTVYEQAREFRPTGAGINFSANGTRVFQHLGLGQKMFDVGIKPLSKINREYDSGREFYTIHPLEMEAKYGAPFVAFHRGALHQMLISAVPEHSIKLNKRLKSLDQNADSITLHFEDGSSAQVDAVIGADGVHSKVREMISAESPKASYAGRVAYRAIFPHSPQNGFDLGDHTRWWAPDRYVLMYYMDEPRQDVNLCTGGPEPWEGDEFMPQATSTAQLVEAFADFHPDAVNLLKQCQQVIRWPLMIRPPAEKWSSGRITLLGDACHSMTPHIGQGGGMAVEDAAMLVRCLDVADADPVQAFKLYEINRHERSEKAYQESASDKLGRGDADGNWLYSYNVLEAPIKTSV